MRALAVVASSIVLLATAASAQPVTLRVIDTAANDVLNVREFPTVGSRIVGVIPPDARNVIYLGEQRSGWLFVRYRRFEGWASARFLAPVAPPVPRGRELDDDE